MNFGGICIETDNAPRLAEFYKIVLYKEPFIEGSHYGFGNIAVYDPGEVTVAKNKNIWLQCFVEDLDVEYERLLRGIPGVEIISPPERRPWGAYSFWPPLRRLSLTEPDRACSFDMVSDLAHARILSAKIP